MNRQHIFGTLVELACSVDQTLDGSAIRLDGTPLKAYGLTSMTVLQLAGKIEDRFGISLSDTEVLLADPPLALVELVERKAGPAEGRTP